MKFQPFITGSGMAGQGMAKALGIISVLNSDLKIMPHIQVKRGQSLKGITAGHENPVLFIGSPHGFHASTLLEGIKEGFKGIVTDKPVCTKKEEIATLRDVKMDIAVTHGFRQNWGPQTIKKMIDSGEFGEIISVEGRYWQCSAAQDALTNAGRGSNEWKNNKEISGSFDAIIDLGAHYTDMMFFFAGEKPKRATGWVSHVNAQAPHRDTHAHVDLEFSKFRARYSISKTVHGTGNDLEFNVIGSKQCVTWNVERPDELKISKGTTTTYMQKPSDRFGSRQPPYHGLGWLEGYVDVTHNYLMKMAGMKTSYPTLTDSLNVMECLLNIEGR